MRSYIIWWLPLARLPVSATGGGRLAPQLRYTWILNTRYYTRGIWKKQQQFISPGTFVPGCCLHPLIIRSRIVDEFSGFSKAGAVAGAIPGVLRLIIFQSTPKMRTPRGCGRKQSDGGFQSVDRQLWAQDAPRRGENLSIRIGLSLYQVG